MDPALLRERELFKKKAFDLPVIEKRKEFDNDNNNNGSSSQPPKKKIKKEPFITNHKQDFNNFKATVPAHNFSILAKIVNSMKERYLNQDDEAVTFEELLDETNQLDLSSKQKQWLLSESLPNNPRILVTAEGRYAYKPVFNLKDKKSLIRLLDKYDSRGLGSITLEDIKESLPNAERIVKNLVDNNKIIMVTRPVDKKRILFYNDLQLSFSVDEEFQKAWRSIAVEGIDEDKIEEYLKNHGISSMQDLNLKKVNKPMQKRKDKKRKQNFKKLNNHMGDLLQDYSDNQP
ncbi:Transcription initiation factor IIE subunit beta [Tyrophagus putrescentiae]|nr:Transcription initiation factor IIE subunit beta [Tyrophagus putrescentiae]